MVSVFSRAIETNSPEGEIDAATKGLERIGKTLAPVEAGGFGDGIDHANLLAVATLRRVDFEESH